ncbi:MULTISPECIES: lytic murein transglycosylase B [Alcanivorax]|uniref:lytic murein transglycosylase B n=1 Tax=Alcanivorax TaxID=59753 RepID=UPI0023578452|nr:MULTISPECIES: lytic murein transglycosylase B [Alcanivorax]MDF1639047.1 lytic murein transglycosylase B [Alcanivorax jadensis]
MRRSYQAILAAALTFTSLPALAEHTCPENNDYLQRDLAKAMIRELVAEGGDEARIRQVLGSAQCQPKILESIARPAEKTHTWATYQKIFLQESRVQKAVEFSLEHADTLARAEQTYGVPREIILAIIGVETRYGQHMGTYRVVDALATLGFDYPPRASFFRKQLKALFELEQKAHIDADAITGSYAGAMGYGQFIPTSYQAYAVDFDNDGITDLVNNPVDAIGSVANYFHEHRWQPGQPVAARARVEGNGYQPLTKKGYKPSFTLDRAGQAGVTAISCQGSGVTSEYCFDLPGDTRVALLDLEGLQGTEFWLATDNFYVITRYNHSRLYAMAVLQLSRDIAAALESPQ